MSLLKSLAVILLFYFMAGTIFLPEGDFSTLPDLPGMYASCKNTEDPDMDLPDFITEHLFEVDGLFGQDIPEPNEKPHQPVQFHHQFVQVNYTARQFKLELQLPLADIQPAMPQQHELCLTGHTGSVFRPPMV